MEIGDIIIPKRGYGLEEKEITISRKVTKYYADFGEGKEYEIWPKMVNIIKSKTMFDDEPKENVEEVEETTEAAPAAAPETPVA